MLRFLSYLTAGFWIPSILLKRMDIIMAKIDDLIATVTDFQSDVSAALERAGTRIDALTKALETANLTAEQQSALDACNESLKAADAVVENFELKKPE